MSAIGFPDWRRQSDYDSNPDFVDRNPQGTNGNKTLGPFNLANFAYIAGEFFLSGLTARLEFLFSTDFAQANIIGTRVIYLDPNVNNETMFCVPALARFCQVGIIPNGLGAYSYGIHMFGSNRPTPNILTPFMDVIRPNVPFALGAGATGVAFCSDYGSGHAILNMETTTQPGIFVVAAQTTLGVYTRVALKSIPAAAADSMAVILPPASVQVQCFNSGAALANYAATLTVSTSQN